MLEATVVEDHIHHHLQSFLVSLGHESAILLVGAETRIHTIVVGGGIAVVGAVAVVGVGRVVLQHWRKPQGSNAELVEVVEVLADALEVTTMAQRRLRAILAIGVHAFNLCGVVGTLCKAVGHEHIEHVGIGEPHALVASFLAFF